MTAALIVAALIACIWLFVACLMQPRWRDWARISVYWERRFDLVQAEHFAGLVPFWLRKSYLAEARVKADRRTRGAL